MVTQTPDPNPLSAFHPGTREWFSSTFGEPTPPQTLGWPAILRGENVLILSPTGSGKTMAAFLCGIDRLFRGLQVDPDLPGVQLLYVSPLKALNNDIERNLRAPLSGIRGTARRMGVEMPHVRVAVRTGDTPPSARQAMVRQPPHILITTPESLYLILTSPKACEMLANVRTVIVDEIHTLCGNKRGVHLALSLERLVERAGRDVQRIGLSATQRPLDEVGRFLVGQAWEGERLESRPVTIIDAGMQKDMDLRVVTIPEDLRHLPEGSIWPTVIPHVLNEIRSHRTTLIFANARRQAERAADRLNEQYALEEAEEIPPGSPAGLVRDGVAVAQGMFGTGRVGGPFRAHHGSVSREVRLDLERKLKAGELPALIGTSSLELGIDIGSVDAVLQLQSPHSVSTGLQRVGRSGHLVGQTSVGRLYATHPEDLLDAAAVAHGMLHGDVEPTYTPRNCLDVLAQQIVAMVSLEDYDVGALYRLVRRAYGYQELPREAFDAVLAMLSGTYSSELYRELKPRISWDRVNDRLAALPGSSLLAIRNGGTIPDRGLFTVYLADRKTRLGTLDEEFVYETREGDVITLGANTWRVIDIDEDRVVVTSAAGSTPRLPFWKGEAPRRHYFMGLRYGAFRRELAERVAGLPPLPDNLTSAWPAEARPVLDWLAREYAMDEHSARNAVAYVRRQLDAVGAISSDRRVVVETFADALGDQRVVIHSCFGGRVNSAWALALSHAVRERLRLDVETQVNDDGIIMRVVQGDRELPLDLVRTLTPDEARRRILLELPDSALFGAQFRMNAARALLLPGTRGTRRTPFWLQRLRARDLLAITRHMRDFPIVAETYRDCLRDVLDLDHLLDVLSAIQRGEIDVVESETVVPSPVASSLLYDLIAVEMYDGDMPKLERQMQALSVNRELLGQLLAEGAFADLLRPDAIAAVEEELQHLADGYRARSAEELAVLLQRLGDLTTEEVVERCAGEGRTWLLELAAQGRVVEADIPTQTGAERRWIPAEQYGRYRRAFALPKVPAEWAEDSAPEPTRDEARRRVLLGFFRNRAPRTVDQIRARYSFPPQWLEEALHEAVETGELMRGYLTPGADRPQWCDRAVLQRIHRRTLSLLRKEIEPVGLAALADFATRWQGLHPAHRAAGVDGVREVLERLAGAALPAPVWARDVLPGRAEDGATRPLSELIASGEWVWVMRGRGEPRRARVAFFPRGEGHLHLPSADEGPPEPLSAEAEKVLEYLQREGALYTRDLLVGLGLEISALEGALVELALAGRITNDRYEALERIIRGDVAGHDEDHRLESSLDEDLAEWRRSRTNRGMIRRARPARLREASRLASQRAAPPVELPGRWSLVHSAGVLGPDLPAEERAASRAQVLLERYGILARTTLDAEVEAASWDEVHPQLQLMELRGQVRRGYFVAGLPGLQYALPEAVDALREWNWSDAPGADDLVVLNAADPANVYAWLADSVALSVATEDAKTSSDNDQDGCLRVARLPSNYLVLARGVPVLTYEHGSASWQALSDADADTVQRAVRLLRQHLTREGALCHRPRRVVVRSWNGQPPTESHARELLEGLGFRRETLFMVWDGL